MRTIPACSNRRVPLSLWPARSGCVRPTNIKWGRAWFEFHRLAGLDLDTLRHFAHSRDITVHCHIVDLEKLGRFYVSWDTVRLGAGVLDGEIAASDRCSARFSARRVLNSKRPNLEVPRGGVVDREGGILRIFRECLPCC